MAKKSSGKDGWKAKRWYNVLAPDMFNRANIGKTPADEPEKLIGRVIETSLSDLTNDWSKQNTKIIFKISDVGADNAHTKFIRHEMARDYMRSLIKRGTSKIDANITATTTDGYKLKVKPSCFTIKRVLHPQIRTIRQRMHDVVTSRAEKLDFGQFVHEIVLGKVASDIYKGAKDIYPIRKAEVGKTEVIFEPDMTAKTIDAQPQEEAVAAE
ncbi:MAG: 30S ribosomal protein S3ae [Methanosarcinales archaeon Met12]|nr:MAG: 30S ribosomal protein S3ae [Methanosarcinales archaeon Met12]